jgi:ElaB/YqjD/DUF883 family membrane-anchored ribosome-binding protein
MTVQTPSNSSTITPGNSQGSTMDRAEHKRNLQAAQSALIDEFHTLIGDTEKLLKHTAEVAGGQAEELRMKINENLGRARQMLKENEMTLREQGRVAMEATEEYVHSHPWQSIGIAAGVGFLIGLLARR